MLIIHVVVDLGAPVVVLPLHVPWICCPPGLEIRKIDSDYFIGRKNEEMQVSENIVT